jgi:rSAM/selenodomain-associated transferase 1
VGAAREGRLTDHVLIVFVKAPRPGGVKTRLIPVLGAEGAADFYRTLAEEEVARTTPRAGDYKRLFFYAPPDARDAIASWFPGEALVAQEGSDLGARMAAAFDTAFRGGARRVAIIGSDVPWVTREVVLNAFRALDHHALALGPARDGGYYLLALSRPCPEIFDGVPWSTPEVFPATLEKARTLGLSVGLLGTLTDLDTLDDIRAAWGALEPILARGKGRAPGVLEALSRVLGNG